MITEVYRGNDIGDLLAYLYGPGRHEEHSDPHLVTAWDPAIIPTRDPGRDPNATVAALGTLLYAPVAARDAPPADYVWHCAVRIAEEDQPLDDGTWARVAHRLVAAAGVAPDGDDAACRWVAVRHDGPAGHHIHIAATLARQDGRLPRLRGDWLRLRRAANALEAELGLRPTGAADGTAAAHPTRGEIGKAERLETALARAELAGRVRYAAAASPDELSFFTRLRAAHGVLVRERVAPSGDVTGYAVALPAYRAADTGQPIWFSGSKLAPDLSLPRLRSRWAQVRPQPGTRPQTWLQAAMHTERAAAALPGSPPAQAAGLLSGFGEVLTVAAVQAPGTLVQGLSKAAQAFDPASRLPRAITPAASPLSAALASSARALHRSGRAMSRDQDLQAAMYLLVAAALATRAAHRWHAANQFITQARAADIAANRLEPLSAAHPPATPVGLRARPPRPETAPAKTRRQPPARSRAGQRLPRNAYADAVRTALAGATDPARVLADPAWPTLQRTLRRAASDGVDITRLLSDATVTRELATARSPAKVLHWRISHILGARRGHPRPAEQLQLM